MHDPTPRRREQTIAARILVAIFLISSGATLLVTSLELALDYGQGEEAIEDQLKHAADSSQASLARSLWDVDDASAEATLGGLIKLAHVDGAAVTGTSTKALVAGVAAAPDDLTVKIPLVYLDGSERRLMGELSLASRRQEYNHAFVRKSILFVVIRALKAMLVSLLIYWAIHGMLTRHLISIASFIKDFRVPSIRPALGLQRKMKRQDELDILVESINGMQTRLDQSFGSLSELNATLEKRVEEQTRFAVDRQKQLDASARLSALGRMAAGISHEIKNPLAVVLGNLQLLARLLAAEHLDRSQILSRVDRCEKGVGRIERIVTAMGKLTALEPDQSDGRFVGLKSVFEDLRELSELRCKSEGIALSIDPPGADLTVRGSATQLCQVLLNLVSNACDAVSGVEGPAVSVSWRADRDNVEIVVRDNGHGIPPEIKPRIMEPFFTTKEPGKGVGLGLSLSCSIVELHSGKLAMESVPGDTRFTLTLPLAKIAIAS